MHIDNPIKYRIGVDMATAIQKPSMADCRVLYCENFHKAEVRMEPGR